MNKLSFEYKLPKLAKGWHPTKNGDLTPYDVTPGSNKKVWWKCPLGVDHEWQAMVSKRSAGRGCPICSGHKVVKSTSLGTLNPNLAKEWHPTKNGDLTPFEVSPTSGKKVWWKCSKDESHEWAAFIINRHRKGVGCPICSNKKTTKSKSFGILNADLARDWHPTKNGELTPYHVTPGSSKNVWWQCRKEVSHQWQARVVARVRGTGCPHCGFSTSRPEIRIYSELKTIFPLAEHRKLIEKHEVDIYVPEINFGIEYDGEYWHRGKEKKDRKKNEVLGRHLSLLRVREKGLSLISDTDIGMSRREITLDIVKRVLKEIKKQRGSSNSEILAKIDRYLDRTRWANSVTYKKLISEKNQVAFKDSLSHLFPELAKEWHSTRNHHLLPEFFTPGSQVKVWWQCKKGDDHEWKASPYDRTTGGGCTVCAGKKIVKSNSLATLAPEIAAQWDYSRNNGITPDDVGLGSNKKFWWKCKKGEDHKWRAAVNSRSGCPICSNRKAVKSNCLATLNPKIASEWHPTKNGKLTPSDITPGSNRVVWWKCDKGDDHEWKAQVLTREKGLGCPVCSNQKVVRSNCLATLDPELAKQWHPTKNGKLTPYDLGPGSGKKVWWKGKCGHVWETSVRNRTAGKDCNWCKHKKALKTRRKNQVNKNQLVFDEVLK